MRYEQPASVPTADSGEGDIADAMAKLAQSSVPQPCQHRVGRAARRPAGGQTPPPPRRPKDAPWREGALRYASHCPLDWMKWLATSLARSQ
jgi:hypothetical protein